MTTALTVLAVLALVGVVLFGLDQLALWAERRGWLFYRHEKGKGSVNLGFLDQIYQPAMEHVIEEETTERTVADQAESGDEPDLETPS
jgi:hypothetical protein